MTLNKNKSIKKVTKGVIEFWNQKSIPKPTKRLKPAKTFCDG
jgi:hypothetical protein